MSKRNYDQMSKTDLRAACKAAGISYGKLTVAGMREALMLRAARNVQKEEMVAKAPASKVEREMKDVESDKEFKERMLNKVCDEIEPAPVATTAAKAERIVQNGVKRPREGGLCAAVWTDLDKLLESGVTPTSQQVRDLATARGWSEGNALTELSAWRRFNSLSRQQKNMKPKGKAQPKAAPARRIDGEVDQYAA